MRTTHGPVTAATAALQQKRAPYPLPPPLTSIKSYGILTTSVPRLSSSGTGTARVRMLASRHPHPQAYHGTRTGLNVADHLQTSSPSPPIGFRGFRSKEGIDTSQKGCRIIDEDVD